MAPKWKKEKKKKEIKKIKSAAVDSLSSPPATDQLYNEVYGIDCGTTASVGKQHQLISAEAFKHNLI